MKLLIFSSFSRLFYFYFSLSRQDNTHPPQLRFRCSLSLIIPCVGAANAALLRGTRVVCDFIVVLLRFVLVFAVFVVFFFRVELPVAEYMGVQTCVVTTSE
jgi:hypothetical protein